MLPQRIISVLATMICSVWLSACGQDEDFDLDKEVITSLPDGNATGTQATGIYPAELNVLACKGICPQLTFGSYQFNICKVDDRFETRLEIEQEDGRLEVILNYTVLVARLTGGLYKNGRYDIGGLPDTLIGELEILARSKGRLTTRDGRFVGKVKLAVQGTIGEIVLDCKITTSISGVKNSEE